MRVEVRQDDAGGTPWSTEPAEPDNVGAAFDGVTAELSDRVGSIVADEDWAEVRTVIVAVLADEGRRLQQIDESLRFGAGGARMRSGEVACWLTVSRPEAVDPHMETTVGVSGAPGSYRMRIDIGTFEGEVLAEFEDPDDRSRTPDEMVTTLRQFLDDNSGLLEHLATT